MGQVKLTNFAQVLRLIPLLTDGERATLRDVLRPAPKARAAKKPRTPRSDQPELKLIEDKTSDGPLCGVCGYTESYQDHSHPSPNYHEFEGPKVKSKKVANG